MLPRVGCHRQSIATTGSGTRARVRAGPTRTRGRPGGRGSACGRSGPPVRRLPSVADWSGSPTPGWLRALRALGRIPAGATGSDGLLTGRGASSCRSPPGIPAAAARSATARMAAAFRRPVLARMRTILPSSSSNSRSLFASGAAPAIGSCAWRIVARRGSSYIV